MLSRRIRRHTRDKPRPLVLDIRAKLLTAERLFSSGKGGAKALQPIGHGAFIRLNLAVIPNGLHADDTLS